MLSRYQNIIIKYKVSIVRINIISVFYCPINQFIVVNKYFFCQMSDVC